MQFIQPNWPAPAHVRAAFTTRTGGVSAAPFDSLNLGNHVNDSADCVARNRALLQQAITARPVFLQQVHGVAVAQLQAGAPDGTIADGLGSIVADRSGSIVADACLTQQRGLACTIMVADCLPVLLTNRAGSFVAAAHAGWRGLLGQGGVGVLEAVYESFKAVAQVFTAQPAINNVAHSLAANDIITWLGPCIGPQQFEVGAEVREAFVAQQPGAARHFVKLDSGSKGAAHSAEKYLANLPALARDRLQALGISQIYGNDGSDAWCTASNPSQFFSHRRDAARLGSTGRMAACIWLAD
jgi:polyphenol oxidase